MSLYDERLNTSWLAELYGDDYAYALDMFDAFLSETVPAFEREVAAVLQTESLAALKTVFHKYTAAPSVVGLPGLEKQLQYLEQLATENDMTGVRVHLSRYVTDLAEWLPIVQQQRDRLSHQVDE